MARKPTIKKRISNLFNKTKTAIITTVAVVGGILMATALLKLLPDFGGFYTFTIGLVLVLFSGYLGAKFIKRKNKCS